MKKNKIKLQLILSISIILLIAYISSFLYFRIDLTSDKRYTLSETTKNILKNLDDIVFVKVYLDGELNIPFKKMQKNLRETLDEFKVYAKSYLEYEFINPFEDTDPKTRNNVFNELYKKGLKPSNIVSSDEEGGFSEKVIFPGVIINYRGIEVAVNLLRNNPGLSSEENINNSIQSLEYELINKIRSITNTKAEKIAFIEGHGELNEFQVGDITQELANYFQVDRGQINGKPGIIDEYKAIIIAKPTRKFSEADKFVIDQYIMNGGKVLWFIDEVNVSLDSLINGSTIALINQLNIEDLLFRYGVRINPNLIQDIQCNLIPVNTALAGNPANFVPAPWPYYPLLTAPPSHPVTRNLNMIKTEFVNSLDTIAARKQINKHVLLKSSQYSKIVNAPVKISLEEIKRNPRKDEFRHSGLPVAVLLEGKFESAFKNRMLSNFFPQGVPNFKSESIENKMLVVSDGDIIRNDIKQTPRGTMVLPLEFDKYTRQTFGNTDFIINAVNYLTGLEDLMQLRSREFRLRLLDKTKIKEQRIKWQLINTALPILIILIFGVTYNYVRKQKYAR